MLGSCAQICHNVFERVSSAAGGAGADSGVAVDPGCSPVVEGNEARGAAEGPAAPPQLRRVTAGRAERLVEALRLAHEDAKAALEAAGADPAARRAASDWLDLLREAWLKNANTKATPAIVVDASGKPYCPASNPTVKPGSLEYFYKPCDLVGGARSIGEALAQLGDGQSIYPAPGLYEEQVVVEVPVRILGTRDVVIAVPAVRGGGGGGEAPAVRLCGGSRAALESVEIVGGRVGVEATGLLSAPQLRGVTVRGCSDSGLRFGEGARGTAEDCDVTANKGDGVRVEGGADPALRGCRVRDNGGDGAALLGPGTLGTLEGCDFGGNGGCAVRVANGADPIVRDVTITAASGLRSKSGVVVEGGARGLFEGLEAGALEVGAGCSPVVRPGGAA
eukprot:tig00020563_g11185.t1